MSFAICPPSIAANICGGLPGGEVEMVGFADTSKKIGMEEKKYRLNVVAQAPQMIFLF